MRIVTSLRITSLSYPCFGMPVLLALELVLEQQRCIDASLEVLDVSWKTIPSVRAL